MLRIVLPKLADGFEKQKGDIFEFGENITPSNYALSTMDSSKLENAPLHNLGAERSVGFINYELDRRGARELSSASSSQVKHKSQDLIEKSPSGSFRCYGHHAKPGSRMADLKLEWCQKQKELKQKGLDEKALANLSVERRKTKDLTILKAASRPFTSSSEVDVFLNSTLSQSEKLSRLYVEVRYARDTSLSIPKTSDIFRLMKDHKKLAIERYATNLRLFLDSIQCRSQEALIEMMQLCHNI